MNFFLAFFVLFLPSVICAQTFVNESKTSQSKVGIGPALAFSEVEYKTAGDHVFSFKRKTLGLTVNAPLNDSVGALLQGGYSWKSEFENGSHDGTGYAIGGGLNGVFHRSPMVAFVGYGLLNYQADSFDYEYGDLDMTTTDLHLGTLAVFPISQKVDFYVGVDLVPYSDGSIDGTYKYKDKVSVKHKVDFERDEALGIKIGANIGPVRPELTLGSEKTFSLTAAF